MRTTQAREPRLECALDSPWDSQPQSPKAASKVSHEARRSSEEFVGSAHITPSQLRIATVRHGGLNFFFVVVFAFLFWSSRHEI